MSTPDSKGNEIKVGDTIYTEMGTAYEVKGILLRQFYEPKILVSNHGGQIVPLPAQHTTLGKPFTPPTVTPAVEVHFIPKGDHVLGVAGHQIFHGSKVRSVKDGFEGTVTYIEPNGTHVKVQGADGKIYGRKASTLRVKGHDSAGQKAVAHVATAPFTGGGKSSKYSINAPTKNADGSIKTHTPSSTHVTGPTGAPEPAKVIPQGPWTGKPAPTPPSVPAGYTGNYVNDQWMQEARAKYAADNPGKVLDGSKNFYRYKAVLEQGDTSHLDYLRDKNFITQEQHDDALSQINGVKAELKKQNTYDADMKKFQQDMADWQKQNGISDGFSAEGFAPKGYAGAKDFMHDSDAMAWANSIWPAGHSGAYTSAQLAAISSYTGSGYASINPPLFQKGESTLTSLSGISSTAKIRQIDAAMDAAPRVPEDIVVRRGIGFSTIQLPGGLKLNMVSDDFTPFIGKIFPNFGYSSTSVGQEAAFNSHAVQMNIRVPKGFKAIWVSNGMSSQGPYERELLLDRGAHYLVHSVTKKVGSYGQVQYFVDCEIVPAGWTPP